MQLFVFFYKILTYRASKLYFQAFFSILNNEKPLENMFYSICIQTFAEQRSRSSVVTGIIGIQYVP